MMQDELLELRNLGKTSVQWLHAVGVHTKDQLVDRGPVRIYQAVKNRGFRANRVSVCTPGSAAGRALERPRTRYEGEAPAGSGTSHHSTQAVRIAIWCTAPSFAQQNGFQRRNLQLSNHAMMSGRSRSG